MKIAFFHELTPLSGAKKVAEEYGKILKKKHQVDLFYVDGEEDFGIKNIFNKVFFFKFNEKKWYGGNWKIKIYKDTLELIKLYFLHKKIAEVINNSQYDFVFVNPSKFTQAPFLLKFVKNSVYFCQEPLRIIYDSFFSVPKDLPFLKRSYEKFIRRIRKQIDRQNIRSAQLVLANSLYSKDNIKLAYSIDSKLCYLGVDTVKFTFKNVKKDCDVLFIGEKSMIDGFDLLDSALSLYKNKPKVRFITRSKEGSGISESELIKQLNHAKIVLSLSINEPFGLIPIEAMACGIPIIAVDEGGCKESIIDKKSGFLITRSPKVLKNKIDLLLKDSVLRNKFSSFGRKHVLENFTWEISTNRFLKIIDQWKNFN